jgi:hypothetical protein
MDNFVLELPELKYDRVGLINYQASIKDWHPNHHFMKAGLDTSSCNFFDYYPDEADSELLTNTFNNIANLLPLERKPFKFTKVLKGGILPDHIDPSRDCILMLPLTENPSKVVWKENGVIIKEHIYRCPTVINGKILHGVPEVLEDRIFLQCKITCNWETLQKSHKSMVDSETK